MVGTGPALVCPLVVVTVGDGVEGRPRAGPGGPGPGRPAGDRHGFRCRPVVVDAGAGHHRVATSDDETSWVELARNATGAQLERLVRGVRRAQRTEEDAADPEEAAWRTEARVSYDEDGTLMISLRLPAEQGRTESSAEASPRRASLAEGLVQLARIALEAMATTHPEVARRNRSRLVAHVDPLSGWARLAEGELLPPCSLAALETPAVRLRPLTPADLTRHDLGRTQRLPSLVLRELIGTLDGQRCRFPGCTRVRTLHAHHVQFWSNKRGHGPRESSAVVFPAPHAGARPGLSTAAANRPVAEGHHRRRNTRAAPTDAAPAPRRGIRPQRAGHRTHAAAGRQRTTPQPRLRHLRPPTASSLTDAPLSSRRRRGRGRSRLVPRARRAATGSTPAR